MSHFLQITIQVKLPVSFPGYGGTCEVTSVVGGVGSSEEKFSAVGGVVSVKIEAEFVFHHHSLFKSIVKPGFQSINRNRRVRHSEETVKFGSNKSKSRLLQGFTKQLSLHSQISNSNVISTDESRALSTSILNGKVGAVGEEG